MEQITNTVERQRAQYLYDTYFDPGSETVLDFMLFDTLECYGAIDDGKTDKMAERFDKIGERLFEGMAQYDKKLLDKR